MDGLDLVRGYLGREPSMDAFLDSLGLNDQIPEAVSVPGTPVYGEATRFSSGLECWSIESGEGDKPLPTDYVRVHYTGWLEDGTKFDSSHDKGVPVVFKLTGVIAGWTEGVGDMRVGAKRKLRIPPELGWGSSDNGPIPANSTVIFDVELLEINPYAKVPPMEQLPGDPVTGEASTSDSGLSWYDIVDGEGDQPADPSSSVEVHYTGWLVDGTKFDSSVDRGQTYTLALNRFVPGFAQGVGSMKVGGKRKLIIPANLGYGERGGGGGKIPPGATLVFDVELVSTSN